MISSEVQRTLVKSPPELWAELSDPDSLARHLGELGEIKITRSEPEKLVEWEAAGTTGKVAIKASGWGTRVTLSVERELPEPAAEEPEPAAEAEIGVSEESQEPAAPAADALAEPPGEEPAAAEDDAPPSPETEPIAARDLEEDGSPTTAAGPPRPAPATEAARRAAGWPAPEPSDAASDGDLLAEAPAEPSAAPPEPAPQRRGFFARLFGSRRKRPSPETAPRAAEIEEPAGDPAASPLPETTEAPIAAASGVVEDPEIVPTAEQTVAEDASVDAGETEPEPTGEVEPQTDPEPVGTRDIAAELQAAEESATAEVTAILAGVLDRLGAAHHRPFSRA